MTNTEYHLLDKALELRAPTVDGLVVQGIEAVLSRAASIHPRAGAAKQAAMVSYRLDDSRARVHALRAPTSVRYMCRELIAFFEGSLYVERGLAQASSYWRRVARADGQIASNYGYHAFHQPISGKNQFDWASDILKQSIQSRRAIINFNQVTHKEDVGLRDFPCAVSAHFLVTKGLLWAAVNTRSCDVIWGLPYDLAFFSLLTELMWARLVKHHEALALGPTILIPTVSQIYDATAHLGQKVLDGAEKTWPAIRMPTIDDPETFIEDMTSTGTRTTAARWIRHNAGYEMPASHPND